MSKSRCCTIPATCVRYLSRLGYTVAAALDGLLNQVPPVTISNGVAGATVAAPALDKPWKPVAVDFTQSGVIELPLLSSVPENFAYMFYRAITGAAGQVEVVPNVADLMDGRSVLPGNPVNGGAYLVARSAIGTPLIVRASQGTWVTSGGFIASPNDTLAASAPLTLWAGHRFISVSGAGPVVVTLPVIANVAGQGVPRGSRLTAWTTTVGPHSIAAGAGTLIHGSLNGVNYVGVASVPFTVGQTVHLEAFSSLVWLVH